MSEKTYNKSLGRLRLSATFGLIVLLVLLARPSFNSVVAGALIVALGEAVRFWSAGHLLKTQELVTAGPYRFTRNPLYLGRLLIFSGLCIMVKLPFYASWWVLVAGWGLFFFGYLRRKERVEPARLRELHGEAYDRYFKAVPALFPTLRPYDRPSSGRWAMARMMRNREYLMVLGLALVIWFLSSRIGSPSFFSWN